MKFFAVTSRKAAIELASSAVKVVKVCGGYAAFMDWTSYRIWKNQK